MDTGNYEPNVVFLFTHRPTLAPRHDPIIDAGDYLRETILRNDREFNEDLRLIGLGLLAGYLFVIIARLSAMGVLS